MTLAANIAKFYGQEKEQRNQDGWLTCCRVHGDNKPSLSVQGKGDGDVYVHCHAGCDWKDIKDQFRADGVLPELQSKKKNGEQTKVHTTRSVVPTPAADQVATEVEKASLNWKHAIHDNLSHVKNLNNRGLFAKKIVSFFDGKPDAFLLWTFKVNQPATWVFRKTNMVNFLSIGVGYDHSERGKT